MDEYKNQYQADEINYKFVSNTHEEVQMFENGQIDNVNISDYSAAHYKNSKEAHIIYDDNSFSLFVQPSKEKLEAKEYNNINKTILTYVEFRQALSMSIDREALSNGLSSHPITESYGLFSSTFYYYKNSGLVYTYENAAKLVLCDVYRVDFSKYSSFDEAYNSITGQNLDIARTLVDIAYDKALRDGEIDEDDIVTIKLGGNIGSGQSYDIITNSWLELVKGTKLEGRLEFEESIRNEHNLIDEFLKGNYDIIFTGFEGTIDSAYMLNIHLNPNY